ncbi:DEAD/DEAH box helicase family protein [Imperialibacter roseus]|uniref:DEAD/DEAH box helicase family protein n=1 Tax=Imperialibacter roseus TaxID=1324217 RepID=A0ABZ0IJ63_9BACT|nr:DEAD/DEAH box helicase family protein [Imperialibacter roseus]WOK05074.1 DEAD/DEAH box helicase family protein [Imperialibacter roseus]
MLSDIDVPQSLEYRTGSEYEPLAFYFDALLESTEFDLLLGYFSTSAIRTLALGFAQFIYNGGKARIVINQFLSKNDKELLLVNSNKAGENFTFSQQNIGQIKDALSDYGQHFFECVAWLIATKRVEIRAIKPRGSRGIAHYKSGYFSDGVDIVRFNGSCNFTQSGLVENLEEINVKPSWILKSYSVEESRMEFDEIFNGKAEHVEMIDPKDIIEVIHEVFGNKDLNQLLIDEEALRKGTFPKIKNKHLEKTLKKAMERIETSIREPRFPYPEGPRDYQIEAYEKWVRNDCQGIFAMATGSGKTLTALNCVLNEYHKSSCYQAVILVPTKVLVGQWEKECKLFTFQEVIKVSSSEKGWQNELSRIIAQINFGISTSFIIISTYASFIKPKFQEYFERLPKEMVFIADEAHNVGSPSITKLLNRIQTKKRIALSATPKRNYDPEGSVKMEEFFNDREPYTYSFSMERAINEAILCQYYYYPRLINLTDDEMEKYAVITGKLVKYFNYQRNKLEKNSIVEQLLMERKRIIHKAQNKLLEFSSILHDLKTEQGNLEYTLVYAPEGFFSDNLYSTEEFDDLTEENRIIDFYSNIIRKESPTTTVAQYTSDSNDKQFILDAFAKGTLDVLLSMKCLDEGVDIPRTEKAIFCSSTGNPRQFVQRRGRILRKHKEKRFAYIYDMVVIPKYGEGTENFQIERAMVQKELERVVHFGFMALNKYDSIKPFEDICNYYQLNLDTIHNELI